MAEVKVSALTALTGANVANGDELYIVDTGSPNVSKKITADELAQMPQLSSRYAPQANDRIFLSAGEFHTRTGSPSQLSIFNGTSWYLDASTDEAVSTNFITPSWWTTFDVVAYVANTTASSGDVRLGATVSFHAADATITSSEPSTYVTIAAGSTGVVKLGTLVTGVSVASGMGVISVRRDADGVADTLANDIAFMGVLLTRAS